MLAVCDLNSAHTEGRSHVCQVDAATPASAPATRQLRHTRSQSRNTPAALESTAGAKQAVEVSNNGVDEEDVDILALSSPSSGDVDITGSPTGAVSAALHAALPVGHLQEVSCCMLFQSLLAWYQSQST